jgi:dTMP kinase
MPGRLIVLEGTEGVGKSTQATRLAESLGAVLVREPGASALGERVRALLLDPTITIEPRAELLLFLAARAQLVPVIRRHLAEGTTVVADRFFLSTYAYQGAGRGLPEAEIRELNRVATEGLVPDLTLLLVFPPAAGLARAESRALGRDRMERSGVEFHRRVGEAFGRFLTPDWQREHPECGPIIGLDATGEVDAVAARIRGVVTGQFPKEFESWGAECGHGH